MSTYLETALAWHDAGACVIRAGHGKKPVGAWTNYQTQRPTRDQVEAWFTDPATLGLGIVCGAVSGNMEMLEIEGRAVRDHAGSALAEAAEQLGLTDLLTKLMSGYIETTPSGGVHFLYRIIDHEIPGNTKLAQNRNREVLTETRGTGGWTVIAPTTGIHSTGKAWQTNRTPTHVINFTWEERNNIHAIFRTLDELPDETDHRPTTTGGSTNTGDRPGDQWAQVTNWPEILEPHGWKKVFERNGVTHWRRPGKTEGTSATTGYGETGNLHIFTTSTIFELGSYSKFAAYAILNHNGNYTEAAKQLASQGYGKPADHNELQPLTGELTNTTPIYKDSYAPDEPPTSTWKPIDLDPYWFGTDQPETATLFTRQDGYGLLYPGKTHSFYGESESGKSWLAQVASIATLQQGGNVIYIDFEADPRHLVKRLAHLGQERTSRFQYLRPEEARKPDDEYWQQLLHTPSDLIIIDGVTEALTMWGGESKDNDQITKWMRAFPRTLAIHTGAAVVTIDHVTKDKETRGRFPLGGQAKLASIDGAAYLVEPLEALAPGKTGRLTIRVTKDRPGSVRAVAGQYRRSDRTQEAAVLTLNSTKPLITWSLDKPLSEEEAEAFRTELIDHSLFTYIQTHPDCTKGDLFDAVTGDDHLKRERLRKLLDNGFIRDKGKGTRGAASILVTTDKGDQQFAGQLVAFKDANES